MTIVSALTRDEEAIYISSMPWVIAVYLPLLLVVLFQEPGGRLQRLTVYTG